jgi:hypothetical protein
MARHGEILDLATNMQCNTFDAKWIRVRRLGSGMDSSREESTFALQTSLFFG